MLVGHRRAAGTVRILYQLQGRVTGENAIRRDRASDGGRSADERRVPE